MNDNLTVDDYVGIGTTASNSYKLDVNGTARFVNSVTMNDNLTVDDYVGIGTTASTNRLKIVGGSTSIAQIYAGGHSHGAYIETNTNNENDYCVYFLSSDARFILRNNGNVGIGTTSLGNTRLRIAGSTGASAQIHATGATYGILVETDNSTSAYCAKFTGNTGKGFEVRSNGETRINGGKLIYDVTNRASMTNANTGISLAHGAYELPIMHLDDPTGKGHLCFQPTNGYGDSSIIFKSYGSSATWNGTAGFGTERMRIQHDGYVAIGGAATSEGILTVHSSSSYKGIKLMNGTTELAKIAKDNASSSYFYSYGTYASSIAGGGISFVGGKLGVNGITSPSYPLQVTGWAEEPGSNMYIHNYHLYGSSYTAYWEDTGTFRVAIYTDRSIYATGGYGAPSDSRIKENIYEVPDDLSLEMLRNIGVKYYEYKDKINKGPDKTIGFISQQVKTIMPMAVTYIKEYIPVLKLLDNLTWERIDIDEDSSPEGNKYKYKLITDLTDVSGVKCKFYVSNDISNGEIIKEVVGNSDNSFTFDISYSNVFYYGKQVDDFHSLDKQKLFTLNFSATQEIDRIQQQHIIDISNAQTTIQQHETTIQTLQTDLSTTNTTIQQQATTIQQHETIIQQQQQQIADILSRLENLESSA